MKSIITNDIFNEISDRMLTITASIVILTCLISIAAFSNQKVQNDLIFHPAVIKSNNQFYRFFTYGFIHADIIHLAFNMISLWSFGKLRIEFSNS